MAEQQQVDDLQPEEKGRWHIILYIDLLQNTQIFILKMEESQPKTKKLQLELQNLTNLQSRIQLTKKQLNLLLKLDNHQSKDMQNLMKMTFMTTRNKVNLFENHQFSHRVHDIQAEELNRKKEMVREMKQKEEKQVRQMREQMKKNKQNQRSLIRNSSLKYEEMIKMNKKMELERKQQMIKELKMERQRHKQQLDKSKQQRKKQREMDFINEALSKIEKQPTLARQLQILTKKKQEVESRVLEKKNVKHKLLSELKDLKQLKSEQFVEAMKSAEVSPKALKDKQFQLSPSMIGTIYQKSRLSSVFKQRNQ